MTNVDIPGVAMRYPIGDGSKIMFHIGNVPAWVLNRDDPGFLTVGITPDLELGVLPVGQAYHDFTVQVSEEIRLLARYYLRAFQWVMQIRQIDERYNKLKATPDEQYNGYEPKEAVLQRLLADKESLNTQLSVITCDLDNFRKQLSSGKSILASAPVQGNFAGLPEGSAIPIRVSVRRLTRSDFGVRSCKPVGKVIRIKATKPAVNALNPTSQSQGTADSMQERISELDMSRIQIAVLDLVRNKFGSIPGIGIKGPTSWNKGDKIAMYLFNIPADNLTVHSSLGTYVKNNAYYSDLHAINATSFHIDKEVFNRLHGNGLLAFMITYRLEPDRDRGMQCARFVVEIELMPQTANFTLSDGKCVAAANDVLKKLAQVLE